ncbi:hypothetical protein A2661_02760 [Candidatus Giovannonibacteria bacterium RIFCSPHIGHO2_01_FULL_45_24]|uniref:histidine kinase n=1 Tax=Candidatus Giovannonibacteria bacterium RIFCSPLOWO2_01_FULL_46_32 TaxID=1798353 RepID=A0A1F5XGJ9_9BACT|nr:MAG: hypothetical protein A2661_02760 [Candidatus Giovannonibacteria bacterium RIFCSPHIGHO2_01_FULL_45_24]OGF86936.1 MAG: hypothetical protein A3B19_00680 [Candidatus Giovannonibacteria bacterium RIFCSPLOWO2_01_FULL_46_32]
MNTLATQLYIFSLDLIIFLIVVVVDALLIVLVSRSNPKSATNKIFALLNLSTMIWLAITYAVRSPEFSSSVLLLSRLGIFFAALMSALFFMLAHTFPADKIRLNKPAFVLVIISTLIMLVLNISPYAFVEAEFVEGAVRLRPGAGLVPFAVVSTLFSALAVYYLFKKFKNSAGQERQQLKLVCAGMLLMLTLIIATILVPIIFFNSGRFLLFAPLYTMIFFGMTAYAIVKHRLFNTKVFAAEAIVAILWIVLFSKIFVAPSLNEAVIDIFVFAIIIVFGILLVRSVLQEIKSREEIEKLAKDLEAVNEKLRKLDEAKSEFISLAGHQLRTPLTVIKGYTSMLIEGTFGEISKKALAPMWKVFAAANNLTKLVSELLDLSRIESGRLKYEFKKIYFDNIIEEVVKEFKQVSDGKSIAVEFVNKNNRTFSVYGDADKLREVVINLLDNAFKYSEIGPIVVTLTPKAKSMLLAVADRGFGMPGDEMPRLFQKFGRTEIAKKERPDGMGIGLYFVKKIIDDHRGRIWAESQGLGKGSTFFVELPVRYDFQEDNEQFLSAL